MLGNLLTGKWIVRAGSGRPLSSASQIKKGKGIVRAGSGRPSSSASQNKKRKRIVRAVLENSGIFHTVSSFNKL